MCKQNIWRPTRKWCGASVAPGRSSFLHYDNDPRYKDLPDRVVLGLEKTRGRFLPQPPYTLPPNVCVCVCSGALVVCVCVVVRWSCVCVVVRWSCVLQTTQSAEEPRAASFRYHDRDLEAGNVEKSCE